MKAYLETVRARNEVRGIITHMRRESDPQAILNFRQIKRKEVLDQNKSIPNEDNGSANLNLQTLDSRRFAMK